MSVTDRRLGCRYQHRSIKPTFTNRSAGGQHRQYTQRDRSRPINNRKQSPAYTCTIQITSGNVRTTARRDMTGTCLAVANPVKQRVSWTPQVIWHITRGVIELDLTHIAISRV